MPDRLMKSRDQIVNCAECQQPQNFTPRKWKDWLRKPEYHLDVSVSNYILGRFPRGLIGRKDLEPIAQEAVKEPNLEHYRRLFLASMIWGFAGDCETTDAGYGPWRAAQMMTSKDFDETLKKTSDLIRSGKIGEAYDKFDSAGIKWCGPAFFTKYFYFLGRAVGTDYPLILDRRVAQALGSKRLLGNDNLSRVVHVNQRTCQISIDRGRKQRDKYL